ncbi:MAG TPA: hypothetical protein VM118_10290, partial [Acidobacteriota bacterium]|nr:hypothetical protein [Acidobacteriota bacterium]
MICSYFGNVSPGWVDALRTALSEFHPELVPFRNRSELADLALRALLDLVVIPVESNDQRILTLATAAKAIPALAVVPVVLWHPDPDTETITRILDSPIDDLVVGAPDDPAAGARLRLVVRRSWRDLDVNPSSRLPGPTTIERVLATKIDAREEFAI